MLCDRWLEDPAWRQIYQLILSTFLVFSCKTRNKLRRARTNSKIHQAWNRRVKKNKQNHKKIITGTISLLQLQVRSKCEISAT
jgi:hypothetical protein